MGNVSSTTRETSNKYLGLTPWQKFVRASSPQLWSTLYSGDAEDVTARLRELLRAAAKNKFVLNVSKKVPESFSNFYRKVGQKGGR